MDALDWHDVLGTAFGLSMDAFAVAILASGMLDRLTPRHLFRLAFHFGLFQALMPTLGWAAGRPFLSAIGAWDHWIAFGLLAAIGLRTIVQSLRGREANPAGAGDDPTRGVRLVALSVATSIDALAIGVTFAALQVKILVPVVAIGLVAAAMTGIGMLLGRRLGSALGRWAELAGGVVLLGIGVKILLEHLV